VDADVVVRFANAELAEEDVAQGVEVLPRVEEDVVAEPIELRDPTAQPDEAASRGSP
jgi:hypothetical protein